MSRMMRDLKHVEESRLAMEYAEERAAANAEAQQLARSRIASTTSRLVEAKALELAENEARQLAQIRAQSERTLAQQAEALAEAERKLEMAAIERRSADLDAARAAAERVAADAIAREAAAQRAEAERQAAAAASERAAAVRSATAAAEARRAAEIEQKSALATRRRAQWAAFWAGARFKPVAAIGAILLLLGMGGGIWLSGRLPTFLSGSDAMPEPRLRLDHNLDSVTPRVASTQPPRDARGR